MLIDRYRGKSFFRKNWDFRAKTGDAENENQGEPVQGTQLKLNRAWNKKEKKTSSLIKEISESENRVAVIEDFF